MSEERVVVAGSYDQDGYLQIYDRSSGGDVVHEMITLEGSVITNVQIAGRHRIVALLAIRSGIKYPVNKSLNLTSDDSKFQAQTSDMQVVGAELCQRGPRHGAHLRRRPEHERCARARPRPTQQPGAQYTAYQTILLTIRGFEIRKGHQTCMNNVKIKKSDFADWRLSDSHLGLRLGRGRQDVRQ